MMRVTSGEEMWSASEGFVGDHVLVDVGVEVGFVGVLALEGIEDGVARPQSQSGGDLAELEIEVDHTGAAAGVLLEEVGQVGGQECLATAAGRRRGRIHLAGDVVERCSGRSGRRDGGWRRLSGCVRLGQLNGPDQALSEVLVIHRQLE
jgi:hypothetical protein